MIRWLVWAVAGLLALGIAFRFVGSEEPRTGAAPGQGSAPPRPAAVNTSDTQHSHDYSEQGLQTKFVDPAGKLRLPKSACDHDKGMYDDASRYVEQGMAVAQALSLAKKNAYERERNERREKRAEATKKANEQRARVIQKRDEVRNNRTWTPSAHPPDPALRNKDLGPAVIGADPEEEKKKP